MRLILCFLSVACLFSGGFLAGQTQPAPKQDPPQERYETKKDHDPSGTGKFYLGREIAQVMGFQGAGWLERPEREREENVAKMMHSLEVKPGDVVADFGAGSGHHTLKLAKLVGDKGKVYAVDIQPEMLDLIGKRMRKDDVRNIVLIHNNEK